MGKTVLQSEMLANRMTLDLHELANGTYVVRVLSGNNIVVERIVLSK